jgi:hypothetical protein
MRKGIRERERQKITRVGEREKKRCGKRHNSNGMVLPHPPGSSPWTAACCLRHYSHFSLALDPSLLLALLPALLLASLLALDFCELVALTCVLLLALDFRPALALTFFLR